MISTVNTDRYKSPSVQTLAVFAKLLTLAYEEMMPWQLCITSVGVKAVKRLFVMVMFAQVEFAPNAAHGSSTLQDVTLSCVSFLFRPRRSDKRGNVITVCMSVALVHHLGKVMSHALENRHHGFTDLRCRPARSIQLISFDINCLFSVGFGPGKKLNFE